MPISESCKSHTIYYRYVTKLYETLPADGLRLIKIGPGAWQEQLDCWLETFQQCQIPPYVALSYVWGDPGKTIQIQLNSHHFHVTENLHEALRLLRVLESRKTKHVLHPYLHDIEPLWIWIDAICINQDNADDKLKQVPRMNTIYGHAQQVVCWLGSQPNDEDPLRYCFDTSTALYEWEQKYGNSSTNEEWVLAFQTHVEDRDLLVHELLQVMQNRWFSRIWTVQEAVLATSEPLLVLGGLVAPARALSISMTMLMLHRADTTLINASHAYSGLSIIDIMRAAERLRQRHDGDWSMSGFARRLYRAISLTASSYACTVPHDMIYGLLGLAYPPSHLPDHLTVNYDVSFQDLYREYTKFLIEETGELVVLQKCLANFPGQPSWVADFRYQRPLFLAQATQTSPPPFVSFTHAGRRLTVQGWVKGRVLMVHSSSSNSSNVSTKSLIDTLEAIAAKSCSISHEPLDGFISEVLVSPCSNSLGVDIKIVKQLYNLLGGVNRFDMGNEYEPLEEEVVLTVERKFRNELSVSWLVVDYHGWVFSLPRLATEVEPLDLCCRFMSSRSSYILRPVQDGYLLLSASAQKRDHYDNGWDAFDDSSIVENFTIV